MSTTPVGSAVGQRASTLAPLALLAWGAIVVMGYLVIRSDAGPILLACSARLMDILVPVLALACFAPVARALVERALPGISCRDRVLLVGPVAMGLLVAWVTVLGALDWLRGETLAITLGGFALVGWSAWPMVFQDVKFVMSHVGLLGRGPGLAIGGVLGVALVMTCTPAISQDALHYHLSVPQAWLAAGGFCDVPGNVYSRFPMNGEALFAVGLALRDDIAAKVFHWVAFLFTTLVVWRLAARVSNPRYAGWAALAFASVPTAFRVATWAYVEHIGLLFLLLAWLVITLPGRRTVGRIALAGWFAGLACGTKYTFLPPAAFLCAWAVVPLGASRWRSLAAGSISGCVGGGFWYFRNLLELGNPVFPFLYDRFGGDGWDCERARNFADSLSEWGSLTWQVPVALTYRASFASIAGFDGVVGPTILVALPVMACGLIKNPSCRPTGLFALVLAITWGLATLQIRFLLPFLAVSSVLIPAGIEVLSIVAGRAARGILATAVLVGLLSPLILFTRLNPLPFWIGSESRDAFCDRNFSGGDYTVFRGLDRWVPDHGRVLMAAGGSPTYLCTRPVYADSVVENHTLRQILTAGKSPMGVANELGARGFTHLLFRFALVFGEASDLSPSEQQLLMTFLNDHAELEISRGGTLLYELKRGEGK